jgi:hypothetical protein
VYYIGTTSLLSWALGVAPAKDNFWSSDWQPGSAYGNNTHEPFSEMEAAVAAYSTGPVTPSDGVGFTNVSLVLMTCTRNGTLLQPSRPMSTIDACYAQGAFGASSGAGGGGGSRRGAEGAGGGAGSLPKPLRDHVYPIMSSFTAVNVTTTATSTNNNDDGGDDDEHINNGQQQRKWTDVLAIGLAGDGYDVTAVDLPLDLDTSAASFVAWTGYSAQLGKNNVTVVAPAVAVERRNGSIAAGATPTLVKLAPANYSNFGLWHIAPVLGNSGTVFLGEPVRGVGGCARGKG